MASESVRVKNVEERKLRVARSRLVKTIKTGDSKAIKSAMSKVEKYENKLEVLRVKSIAAMSKVTKKL